ncbi:MAG: hypothetical protein WCL18_05785 [bacterium]
MPLIEVLGASRMWRWRRRKFKTAMREAVASIPKMQLTPSQVSVLTFREAGGFDGEIHVRCTFNEKEERTPEVRDILAQKIAEVTEKFFHKTRLIEVWGNPCSKDNGFYSITNEKWEC